jgi:hypothetical protein
MYCFKKVKAELKLLQRRKFNFSYIFLELKLLDSFLLILMTDRKGCPSKHFDDFVATQKDNILYVSKSTRGTA